MLSTLDYPTREPPLFALSLPSLMSHRAKNKAASDPQPGPAPNSEASALTLMGKRVVICEDEGITQMQLRRALTHAGLIVAGIAGNGQAAVEVVLRERPDIVLMDIRMPIMDGLEAARRILAEYRVCILMLTAFTTEEYQEEAQRMGACGYIVKPIMANTLLPEMRKALLKFHAA